MADIRAHDVRVLVSYGLKNPVFGRDTTTVLSELGVIVTSDGSLPGGVWDPNEDGGTDDGTSLPSGVLLSTARRTAREQGLDLGNCTKFVNICEIIKPPEKFIVFLVDSSETAMVKGRAGNPGTKILNVCICRSRCCFIYHSHRSYTYDVFALRLWNTNTTRNAFYNL